MRWDDPSGNLDSFGPAHAVQFAHGFWMSQCEVTRAQWSAVTQGPAPALGHENRPVDNGRWTAAEAFVERLYPGFIFRLPSEAEWMYACRARTTTTYYWGDDLDQHDRYAWLGDNADNVTHDVGLKAPNAWDFYDMVGNVWDWVQNCWHDSYEGAPTDGSAWEAPRSNERVLRGGSAYVMTLLICGSAGRYHADPDSVPEWWFYPGLRVVCVPSE